MFSDGVAETTISESPAVCAICSTIQTVLDQRDAGHPVLRWYYQSSFVKQYTRGDRQSDRILRTETCSNDTYHFGVGRRLEKIARTAGDSDMVVSATPSENTVRFYLGRGFQPMAEPFAELFELEPEDVHMRKML